MSWDRRKFLRDTGLGAASLTFAATTTAQDNAAAPWNEDGNADGNADGQANGPKVQAYKRLGRTGLKIADVSFGASRLRDGQEDLVRQALDQGVNYFDTAESYGGGSSERVIGNALKGQRDKVILASKQFSGASTRRADMEHELNASLKRLQTDVIDLYFNHAVNDVSRLQNSDWGEFVERAQAAGKIRFTGISGHAGNLIENLDYALDEKLVDVILVAHNFGQDPAFYERITKSFDFIANQPDLPRVLAKAKQQDVGVIAMKTLMGARLNDMRPYESGGHSFAQAALRWTLANQDVDALIISMTTAEQINEYLSASGSAPTSAKDVSSTDLALLKRYANISGTTHCRHACNDCSGACPFGVPIADVLRTRMYATDYGDVPFAREEYAQLESNANACLSCDGSPCASACTHDINIAALCGPTHKMLV